MNIRKSYKRKIRKILAHKLIPEDEFKRKLRISF